VATATENITLPRLEALCERAFRRTGLSGPDAATGAAVLSTTDAWGVVTHGSKALRGTSCGCYLLTPATGQEKA
jgi:LDH2 family malate/lactate/ureidoglycolate dehydrogenase